MPRGSRCLTLLSAALLTTSFCSASQAAHHARRGHSNLSRPSARHHQSVSLTQAVPPGRLGVRLRLGDGLQTWHPFRKQLGVSYTPGTSESSPEVRFVVSRAPLRAYLHGIAPYVQRVPKNASVVVTHASADDNGEGQIPAKVIPGYDGAVLDEDAAVDLIQKTLQADPGKIHIILPIKKKPARVTTAELKGINARVGYFVTRFNPGDEGRTSTVRHAIRNIDGTVVAPGKIFSVDQTVGPRDPAHGFNGKAHVFVNNHIEIQSGGGMCQVATTLFNAAMLADLKIVERHQHVRTVPYVDPGRDATIYHDQKDFKIQNDTNAPLFISYKTNRSHAIVSLFGKSVPGRKVKLVSHHRELGPRWFTGVFYRVVHQSDGKVVRGEPIYSVYHWPSTLDYQR